ncbi:MAG: hypothetical protein N2747_00445 [Chitinophagaceae bacterium]|nr:hypothetical protein [Chitinophagaceae bacterium]
MRIITTQKGDTPIEVAIRYCGDVELSFQVALANDVNLTQKFNPGIEARAPEIANLKVVQFFERRNKKIIINKINYDYDNPSNAE